MYTVGRNIKNSIELKSILNKIDNYEMLKLMKKLKM